MTEKLVTKSAEEWQQQLTSEQYKVCRNKGTERAFSGEYYNCRDVGIYRCICCGSELFDSNTKFDSGTGWPSFYQPIEAGAVKTEDDSGAGMHRVEVMCNTCNAHLGHIFPDGPDPTGLRYCINSAALKLEKSGKLKVKSKMS